MKQRKGFALVELLIIVGIIAILAAIIYAAVDPAKKFAEARNAERWSSVNAVLKSYLEYMIDNGGSEPAVLTAGTYYLIGTGTDFAGCTAQVTAATVDLTTNLVGKYLSAIPIDPNATGADAAKTFYYITKTASGRITVGACAPELDAIISVSR